MESLVAATHAELAASIDLIARCSVRRLARAIPARAYSPRRTAFIVSTPPLRKTQACAGWRANLNILEST